MKCEKYNDLDNLTRFSGEVEERNIFYSFGSRYDVDGSAPSNRYLYNDKEDQEFAGLPYVDYGSMLDSK